MRPCAEPCRADSPDSPTFAETCRTDSPDSPTFAEPCCADSPNSPTFAKPLTEYSPDSPTFAKGIRIRIRIRIRHIRTSNSPFWRIWGEWPLLNIFTHVEWLCIIQFLIINKDWETLLTLFVSGIRRFFEQPDVVADAKLVRSAGEHQQRRPAHLHVGPIAAVSRRVLVHPRFTHSAAAHHNSRKPRRSLIHKFE